MNDLIFMTVFVYVRVRYCEWLFVRIHLGESPFFFKFQTFGLWYASYVWIWQICNVFSKQMTEYYFPNSSFWSDVYILIKKARKYIVVYHVVVFLYTSRYLFAFYGYDFGVKIFGSSL